MANLYSLSVLMLVYIVGTNCQDCSTRPPMQPHNDCCKVNLTPQQEECLTRNHEQWESFRQSPNKDSSKMADMCASNCILNNTNANVITPDNKVNADEVKMVLEKMLGADWMLSNIIETCKDRIDNGPQGFGAGRQGPANGPQESGNEPKGSGNGPQRPNSPMANCNMTKEMLFFCIREQILINCPDSAWKNSEDCNETRSFIKNCPFGKRGGPGGPRGGQP